jgi:hypothetical protein
MADRARSARHAETRDIVDPYEHIARIEVKTRDFR